MISSLTDFPLSFVSASFRLRILSAVRLVKPLNFGSKNDLSNLSELKLVSDPELLLLLLLVLRGDLLLLLGLILFVVSNLISDFRYLSELLALVP